MPKVRGSSESGKGTQRLLELLATPSPRLKGPISRAIAAMLAYFNQPVGGLEGHAVRLNFLAEFFVQGRVGVIRAEVRIALKDWKHDEQDWDISFLCIAGERFEGAPCLLPMSELIGVQIEVVHIGQVEEFSLERGRAGIQR